jgi:serine protease AprX
MKRGFFLLVITSLLISNIVNAAKIDKNVEDKLLNNSEVSVIVLLKDNNHFQNKYLKALGNGKKNTLFYKKKLKIKEQQDKVLNELILRNNYDFKLKKKFSLVNGFSGIITKTGLEKLKNNPDVAYIQSNYKLNIVLDESIPLVNATKTWNMIYNRTNITGKGETICIIDTGVDYTHPALGGCTTNQFTSGNCSKVISGFDFVNNDNDPIDDNGHGTHVAGIAASTNETYRGVAPNASIVAIKVLNSAGSGTTDNLVSGIDWCVNNASKFNISVISMSLGSDILYPDYCDINDTATSNAVKNAIAINISVIAATGNDGSKTAMASPACLQNVTSVGWSDKNDVIVSNSNRNNLTDLFAPGSLITSTVPNGGCTNCDASGFKTLSGTSMSTPHVAGAFALIRQFKRLESNIILTPFQILKLLNDSGKMIDDTGGSGRNFSRINIFAAIISNDSIAPVITFLEPLNNSNVSKSYVFINVTSNEALDIAKLEWNGTNETMNSSGLNWFLNKTGLANGTYTFKIYGTDFAGNTNFTETRIVNINNTAPNTPILNAPLNNSFFSINFTLLNFTAIDNQDDSLNCYIYGDNLSSEPMNLINITNNIASGSNVIFNWTGLNETTYYWKVQCDDFITNSSNSSISQFTLDFTNPQIYFSGGTENNNSYVSRNWIFLNVSIVDSNKNETRFYLYNSSLSLINNTNFTDNTNSINFTNLNPNMIYYYNITHIDKAGNKNSTLIRKIILDAIAPSINFTNNTALNSSYKSQTWIFIEVNITETNFNNITFYLFNSSFTQLNATNFSTQIFNINFTNLIDGTYYYNVTVRDKAGNENSTETRSITLDTIAPTTNVSLTASGVNDSDSDGNIEISWKDDSNEDGETYRLYRYSSVINTSTISNADLIKSGINEGIQFYEDNTTLHKQTYWYALVTVDRAGNYNESVISSSFDATANDTIKPKSPTNVNVTGSGATATIRWTNMTQDVNGNADFFGLRYLIYYSTSINTSKKEINKSDFTLLANITTNSTTFSVTSSNIYHFVVVTVDDAGNENLSLSIGKNGNYGNISLTYTPPSASSSGGGGSGGGGGGGVLAIASESQFFGDIIIDTTSGISVGKSVKYEKSDQIAITEIGVIPKRTVKNVRVEIRESSKTLNAPDPIKTSEGGVFKYLRIIPTNIKDKDIEEVIVRFKVNKSWFVKNRFNIDKVSLNRYKQRNWEKYPAKRISRDVKFYYYKTIIPGFSLFAITAEKVIEKKKGIINITKKIERNETPTLFIEKNITKPEIIEKLPEKKEPNLFYGILLLLLIIITCFISFYYIFYYPTNLF